MTSGTSIASIVGDRDDQPVAGVREPDPRLLPGGVLDDVGERLLHAAGLAKLPSAR
ncbi:hypothetical protein [Streptomyces albicerus]|uniref:hypothetical protein n=1 Tax=Streptomyces albicerus TaxID=2569859 RepID=UPI00298E88EA|nr:hypothetical protein [Streptomyces albicerus]